MKASSVHMVMAISLVLFWWFTPNVAQAQIRVVTWGNGHNSADSSFFRFVSSVVPDSLKTRLQLHSVNALKQKNEAIELLNRRSRKKTNAQIAGYSTTELIQMFAGPVKLSEFEFKDAAGARAVFNSLEKNDFHWWEPDLVYDIAIEGRRLLVVATPVAIAHVTTNCCDETTIEELTSKEEQDARSTFIADVIKRYSTVTR